jgi:hypothetical protein
MEATTLLIARAAAGDDHATNQLLRTIKQHHSNSILRRYRDRNVLVDDDDLESAFLVGCFEAIRVVDPHKGNPLLYILWRGRLSVVGEMKRAIRKGLVVDCPECGRRSRPDYRRRKLYCRCGVEAQAKMLEDQTSVPQEMSERGARRHHKKEGIWTVADDERWSELGRGDLAAEMVRLFESMTNQIAIEEMRLALAHDERLLDLFDLMVLEDINGQGQGNYQAEIAERWGVSKPAVAYHVKRLRRWASVYFGMDAGDD